MDERSRSLPRSASTPTDESPELHNVLARFSPVQRVMKGHRVLYLVFCPLHQSPAPTLVISLGTTGAVNLCCNGGRRHGLCKGRAICAAIGITTLDLAPRVDGAHVARPTGGDAK